MYHKDAMCVLAQLLIIMLFTTWVFAGGKDNLIKWTNEATKQLL